MKKWEFGKKRHGGKITLGWILAFIVALLVACQGGNQSAVPTPTPLPTPIAVEKPTYTVERGRVVKMLEFTGRVAPVTEQDLFFKTDGYVRAVFVSRNEYVQAGDLLAELEVGDLENQLAQAEVALKTAETTLDKEQRSVDAALAEAQISLARARILYEKEQQKDVNSAVTIVRVRMERAESALTDAQEAYDRAWEPARDWELNMTDPTGTPPYTGPSMKEKLENEREATQRGLASAQANLEIAQAEYRQALAAWNTHDYDVQALEQDVALAEHRVAQLEQGIDPLLELNVEKAQLSIDRIRDQMQDAQLIAPFDGQVLSLNIKAGSRAEAFKTALLLGNPALLEIAADLAASEIRELSTGQQASIRLRDRPEDELSGKVRQLPYATGGATDVESGEDSSVRVALDDDTISLNLGELATVMIVLEERDDSLWLPPAALRTFQGRDFVVIQDGASQQRVDVRLGIEGDDRVEILDGVEEGQTIVGQ